MGIIYFFGLVLVCVDLGEIATRHRDCVNIIGEGRTYNESSVGYMFDRTGCLVNNNIFIAHFQIIKVAVLIFVHIRRT